MYTRKTLWILIIIVGVSLSPQYIQCVNLAWMAAGPLTYGIFNASTSMGSLAYSIQEIVGSPGLLPGETFQVRWKDTSCSSKASVGAIFEFLEDASFRPDLLLGPICSPAMVPVAQLGSYLNLPTFGWITSDPILADKELYTTLLRFLWSIDNLGEGIAILCRWAGWKRVSIISTVGGDYGILAGAVRQVLLEDLADDIVVQRWVSGIEVNPTQDKIKESYDLVKDETRIIILVVPFNELRNWTIGAYDSGLYGGEYVIIYTNQRTLDEGTFNYLTSKAFWEIGDSRDEEVRTMYEDFIAVYAKTLPFATTNRFLSQFYQAAKDWDDAPVPPAEPDFYSLFLHDSMKIYSKYATLAGSINDGEAIFDKARTSITYDGSTGDIVMSDTCDRIPDYWFFDLSANNTLTIAAETITTLEVTTITRNINILGDFRWGDGTSGQENAPSDTPKCGFDEELCEDITIYWVPPLVVVILIIIILIIFFVYRKFKYEHDLNDLVWKLNYDDMNIYMGNKLPGSQMNLRAQSMNLRKSQASVGDSLTGEQLFITVANYKGILVAIKTVIKPQGFKLERQLLQEMRRMIGMKHNNLNTFVGACIDPTKEVCCAWDYCTKGSLQDVIYNDNINLDDMFKFSICIDILKGLSYLHETSLKCHGRLKSSNIVIDSRWTCKLTDFGMEEFCTGEEPDPELSDHAKYSALLWTPPETLKEVSEDGTEDTLPDSCRCHTNLEDIYAAGIIMKEMFCRNSPYHEHEDQYSPKEIVAKVLDPEEGQIFRPELTELASSIEASKEVSDKLQGLICQCWAEDPQDRPTAPQAVKSLAKINPFKKANVVDNMMAMMEKYSNQLEEIVANRTIELQEEQKKTEDLLFKMLPKSVAQDLKQGKNVDAEAFESVTIFFSDIPGFSELVAACTPFQVVDILNGVYSMMDETINNHDVYKVETVGDVYVLVSGLPIRNGDRHVVEVANCAMDLICNIQTFKVPHRPKHQLSIRIGFNTGPIVTGVVGLTNPRYCLFGDTMNTASRMESNGKPLRIHISPSSCTALSKFKGYHLANRGEIPVKGKGMMNTYWLVGRDNYESKLPDYHTELSKDNPKPTFLPPTTGKTVNPKVLRPSAESGFIEMNMDSRKNSSISNMSPTNQRPSVTSESRSHLDVNPQTSPTSGGLTVVDSTSEA